MVVLLETSPSPDRHQTEDSFPMVHGLLHLLRATNPMVSQKFVSGAHFFSAFPSQWSCGGSRNCRPSSEQQPRRRPWKANPEKQTELFVDRPTRPDTAWPKPSEALQGPGLCLGSGKSRDGERISSLGHNKLGDLKSLIGHNKVGDLKSLIMFCGRCLQYGSSLGLSKFIGISAWFCLRSPKFQMQGFACLLSTVCKLRSGDFRFTVTVSSISNPCISRPHSVLNIHTWGSQARKLPRTTLPQTNQKVWTPFWDRFNMF